MSRFTLSAVVLIGILSTAGCLGFLGAETAPTAATVTPTEPTSPAETTTLTATESSTPGATGVSLGVRSAGFLSAERLANAHDATLRNTSFTIRYRETRVRNGTVVFLKVGRLQYDGGGTAYYNYTTVDSESATTSRVRVWRNRTTGQRKVTTGNETFVETVEPILGAPTFANGIEIYMRSFRTRVTGYSRLGGEPAVRVSATELSRPLSVGGPSKRSLALRLGFQHLIEGSFSADVTGGAVRRYRVRFVGRVESELESRVVEVVFTNVGTATVPHPAWATATNASRGG